MTVRIINADVLDGLRQLDDESVQCCVTSPPYWGLRDYGVEGQIGLEATPQAYVARMVDVFREVRRVLRKDGVCFVNIGDSYATNGGAHGGRDDNQRGVGGKRTHDAGGGRQSARRAPVGVKPKDLIGIPWRVAFALQDDGWYLRGDYIWAKPNPMPESVTDRCTKAHEYIFHLSKSERYFWDQEAIKERADWGFPNSPGSIASPYGQGFTRRATAFDDGARPPGTAPQSGMSRIGSKGNRKTFRGGGVYTGGQSFDNDGTAQNDSIGNGPNEALSRNKRSVWTIATTPFPQAHFATFPPEIPETCIKAGTKPGDTILDPFGGAGTTGLVADRLQRNAVLIELNPEYAAMASKRINTDRGALLDIMEAAE